MTDRPILFSAPMVRALLDGRKTQTRRILKPQPKQWEAMIIDITQPFKDDDGVWGQLETVWSGPLIPGMCEPDHEVWHPLPVRFAKGDRLWVKETYTMATPLMGTHPTPCYFATEAEVNRMTSGKWAWKWTPSIFMKRAHSRLTLTVTDVRVQRLQEISKEDAVAEGLIKLPATGRYVINKGDQYFGAAEFDPRFTYRRLWEHINGAGSWDANPWIVALSFTVEKRNIDQEPT